MQEKARNGFDNDPFLLTSSKQAERNMMRKYGLLDDLEHGLPLALDSKYPVLSGVGRTARIHAAQSQSRKMNVLSALASGLALIVPMIIMRLVPGKVCSLVTTSSCVGCFAIVVALLSDLRPNEILGVKDPRRDCGVCGSACGLCWNNIIKAITAHSTLAASCILDAAADGGSAI